MNRTARIVLAAALTAVAALAAVAASSGIELHYLLPPVEGTENATERTAVFEPAVRATVVAGVAALLELGVLVAVAVRRQPRWLWWVAGALAVVAVAAAWWGLSAPHPDF